MLLSVKGVGQSASISISGSNLYTYNGLPQAKSSNLTITYTFGGSDFPNSSVTYTYSGPAYSNSNTPPTTAIKSSYYIDNKCFRSFFIYIR